MFDGIAPVYTATKAWVHRPFRSDMSLWGWLMFAGVVVGGITLWTRVLAHIGE